MSVQHCALLGRFFVVYLFLDIVGSHTLELEQGRVNDKGAECFDLAAVFS
jgi:hypothetical protein